MGEKGPANALDGAILAMIADEDTITGFLLAGVGDVDFKKRSNFLVVKDSTALKDIENAFRDFTTREDIAIVLISQFVAEKIRPLVDRYDKPVPAILEIPSKDHPYDPAKDSILARVRFMFGDG